MKQVLLVLLSALSISACGGGGGTAATIPTDASANPTSQIPATGTNVVSTPDASHSRIAGNITLLNDNFPVGDVHVTARGTDVTAIRQASGEFSLELPLSASDRLIVLDIGGDAIIEKSVELRVPAQAELAFLNATVSARTPPITFNLDSGAVLQNTGSTQRTNVTVPANAFQFEDGTIAIGDAQVSITEIDIEDLEGAGAWAPNLVGLRAGSTQPTALITHGMSDFHFSKDGRALELRPGVQATIVMDLLTPYIWPGESSAPVAAAAGAVLPLWHYDTDEMIWKEEGEATIVADDQTTSGFKASGQVSHFSTWNLDNKAPEMFAIVNIELVDPAGAAVTELEVDSFYTVARIPPEEGPGWHNEASYQNEKSMMPSDNEILVLGNTTDRAELIIDRDDISGFTIMDIIVDSVMIGTTVVNDGPMLQKKVFTEGDSAEDRTVTFTVVIEDPQPPEEVSATVNIVLVDFMGQPLADASVLSYRTSMQSSESTWENVKYLTPDANEMIVQANTPADVDGGTPNTMQITVDNVVVAEPYRAMEDPAVQTKVFKSYEDNGAITFEVTVLPQ